MSPLGGLLVALVLAACGVPSSDGPQPLSSEEIVIGPTAAASATPVEAVARVGVTWVSGVRLVVVAREVAATDRQSRVDAALAALVGGPDLQERSARLSTLVPPDAILMADVAGRRAVVNLDLGSATVDQSLAVGQVAVTVLATRGVRSVSFTVDGVPVAVPLPGGRASNGPVTIRDYRNVIERKGPPPPATP